MNTSLVACLKEGIFYSASDFMLGPEDDDEDDDDVPTQGNEEYK
jgi:hypothetical protein